MKRCFGFLISVICAMSASAQAGAAVWYVDVDSAASSPDGTSWSKAYRTLQQGIDAASTAGGEVWVAEGVYGESRATQADGALVLRSAVQVYGGFAGTETLRTQRDWNAHVCYIDGAKSRTGSQAAYHVVIGAANARLDGFVIRGGKANGGGTADDARRFGGGVYNSGVSPQLANLTFVGSQASSGGGALCNAGGSPAVTNCIFQDNSTAGKGGAVYNASSSATFEGCTFSSNEGVTGGAVHNSSASVTFRTSVFNENSASYGGALSNASASPRLYNCTFLSNTATNDGGAVYNDSASPVFTACAFTSNEAGTGAAANGGAVYNPGSASVFTNCTFQGNSTTTRGGALYGSTSFTVMNCTFKANGASSGGTLYNAGGTPKITNSILWDGQSSEIVNGSGSAAVTYSDVEGGYTGTGNINSNPSFVNTGTTPLRIKPGSPCINTGTATNAPSTDFAGTARPQGAGYDMGAFEGGSVVLTTSVSGSGTVTPVPGVQHYYLQGATATLTATPADDWRFSGWSGGATGAQNPLALTMSGDRSVQANFIRQYTLTVQVEGSGTVNPAVGEHAYDSGTQVTMTPTASTGWRFDHWEGDLTGSTSPGQVTMSADRTVTAVFVRTYTLTVAVTGSGTVSPATGAHVYIEGTVVPVTATPRSGWRFDHWEGSVSGSTNPVSVTMSADRTVRAVFTAIPTYTLTLSTTGSGTLNPASGVHTYQENAVVSITATPATNWAFTRWEGGVSGTANPLQLTMTQDYACTAVFTKIPLAVLELAPSAGLSIGGTTLTLSVRSWTSNCRVTVGGVACRLISATGSGTTQVLVAAPAIAAGEYAVTVTDTVTSEEATATGKYISTADPFDTRLTENFEAGVEIDDNDSLITTYALRAWKSGSAIPALNYVSDDGVTVLIPSTAFPATATAAFMLARIAAQPGDLFDGVTLLEDYRLRSAVIDVHVFVREPAGSGYTVTRLAAPAAGTFALTCTLSPGPVSPLVAGGFVTELDELFATSPPDPADFVELASTHEVTSDDEAVFQLASFGTAALFGDGPYQDINDDGVVDAADIQLVVNAVIGSDIGSLNADIDGDGKVNAVDVQMVINAFLGYW